jgi:type 1 fimbria pilin
MKKILFVVSLGFTCLNAHSTDVPVATDSGTITIKGSAYGALCTLSTAADVTLNIPTTYAADYSKGDTSPLGVAAPIIISCPSYPLMAGVYITVTGAADSQDSSLFKVSDGTDKATGVAIKLTAKSGYVATDVIDILPNKESTLMAKSSGANASAWYFQAQTIATADKVTSGDLNTNLTWTLRYN